MSKRLAYLRTSTDKQDLNNQKLEILEYARQKGMQIEDFIALSMSSRKSQRERRIDDQNQSIEILEIRSRFNDLQKTIEIPIAKTMWVKSQEVWCVFWQRADMKWHRYDPLPEVKTLEEFIDVVEADEYACFYG
jgi:hypothetical protein